MAKSKKPAPSSTDASTPDATPAMRIEWWRVDAPKPYPKNARVIPESAVDAVVKSITSFGFRQPIVVDEQGVVVVGHTRLRAAKKLGMTEVPVHVMRGVPQDKVDMYRLMDNRSNQETTWDNDILAAELADLRSSGYDLSATAFSQAELETHLAGLGNSGDVEAVARSGGSQGQGPHADDTAPPAGRPKGSITCPRCRKHFTPGVA